MVCIQLPSADASIPRSHPASFSRRKQTSWPFKAAICGGQPFLFACPRSQPALLSRRKQDS